MGANDFKYSNYRYTICIFGFFWFRSIQTHIEDKLLIEYAAFCVDELDYIETTPLSLSMLK